MNLRTINDPLGSRFIITGLPQRLHIADDKNNDAFYFARWDLSQFQISEGGEWRRVEPYILKPLLKKLILIPCSFPDGEGWHVAPEKYLRDLLKLVTTPAMLHSLVGKEFHINEVDNKFFYGHEKRNDIPFISDLSPFVGEIPFFKNLPSFYA